MNTEKDLLKQDLSKQEKPEEIQKFIEDTELMGGHEDIIELAKAKLEAIDKKAEQVNTPIPPIDQTKIEEKGGSPEVVQEKVTEVDTNLNKNTEKINEVKTEATEKVEELKSQTQEIPVEVTLVSSPQASENIKKPINVEELKNKISVLKEKVIEDIIKYPNITSDKFQTEFLNSIGKTEEARKIQIQEANDDESKGRFGWAADKYKDLGNEEKSQELYKKELIKLENDTKLDKDFVRAYARYAEVYQKLGNNEKSKEIYEKLIETNKRVAGSKKVNSEAAIAYEKLGDTENAKKMWEEEAKVWEGSSKAELAGEAYEKAGNKEKAEESYKKAIAYQEGLKNKGSDFDSARLLKAYKGLGEKTKVIQILQEAAELAEKNGAHIVAYQNYEALEKYFNSQTEAVENPELELAKQKQEKTKELDKEMGVLLEQTASNLPSQLNEIYNSESYKRLVDLNEKRKVEEKSLYEEYDRYTKDGDGSHTRSFYLGNLSNHNAYVDDLKFYNAPKELIKRFEEYNDKFIIPEINAGEKFNNETLKPLNEVRWNFQKSLATKSEETFGKDQQGAKDFQKKFFDAYEANFNKAKQDTIPDKNLHINTMGTIYS